MGACGAKSKFQKQNLQINGDKQELQQQVPQNKIINNKTKKDKLESLAQQISLTIILPSQSKLSISINTTESIAMMKQIIYHKVMDPQFTEIENPELDILFPYEQRAYCQRIQQDPLDNMKSIQELKIVQDDEIIVQKTEKLQLDKQINLYCSVYIDPYFSLFKVICSCDDTCEQIYEKLSKQLNCTSEELSIYYDLKLENQLERNKLLKDYNIQSESTVSVLLNM